MKRPEKLHRFLAPPGGRPGETVQLDPDQSHHLAVVLRLEAEDRVHVFTGQGEEFLAVVEQADPRASRVRLLRRRVSADRPRLVLGFALPPRGRAGMLVEKTCELGVSLLKPVISERVQGYQQQVARARLHRWRRKARDAARQSERATVPEIEQPVTVERFLSERDESVRLMACAGASVPLWSALARVEEWSGGVALAVGPAGGFTRRERVLGTQAGFTAVSLGPNILRVETAAICMLAAVILRIDACERE